MTTHSNEFRTTRFAIFICTIALIAVGCGGPERAPRQKVSGVDRPAAKVVPEALPAQDEAPVSPEGPRAPALAGGTSSSGTDEPSGDSGAAPIQEGPATDRTSTGNSATGGPLEAFIDRIASAVNASPGVVAIFPPLSKNDVHGHNEINALGARLADEISSGLAMKGINALTGAELQNDLRASNRGLSEFRSPADVYWLADRLNATYVVFGTVQRTVYDRMARDEAMDLRLQCIRTGDRNRIAEHRRRLTGGPLAVSYARDYARKSDWLIGDAAPRSRPSVAQEVQQVVRRVARSVVTEAAAGIRGKRIAVDPCLILGVSGPRSGNIQVITKAFLRALDVAERKADEQNDPNPRQTAMASGPITIAGTQYATLEEAYQAIESRRAALRTSRAGQLSIDIARTLATHMRKAGGQSFEVLADDTSRDAILALIQREADLIRDHAALDPKTVATLRAQGADVLVRSTLRPFMRSYQLRVTMLDVRTAKVLGEETADFEAQFKSELDSITGG